jgi:hypothetical protein
MPDDSVRAYLKGQIKKPADEDLKIMFVDNKFERVIPPDIM